MFRFKHDLREKIQFYQNEILLQKKKILRVQQCQQNKEKTVTALEQIMTTGLR